jgi:hypothetical protein
MDDAPVAQTEVTTKSTVSTVNGPVAPVDHAAQQSVLPGVIAMTLTLGLLAFASVLLFAEIPKPNEHIIDTLFGGLIVGCTTAWGYFFGSSQASDARNAVRASKER